MCVTRITSGRDCGGCDWTVPLRALSSSLSNCEFYATTPTPRTTTRPQTMWVTIDCIPIWYDSWYLTPISACDWCHNKQIHFQCSDGRLMNGVGNSNGEWSSAYSDVCPLGICGIQTKVKYVGSFNCSVYSSKRWAQRAANLLPTLISSFH